MAYRDLRDFINRIEKAGELARVKVEVDPGYEIAAITEKVFAARGKALLFENIKGHATPLLVGAMDTYSRYALAIDSLPDLKSLVKKTLEAMRNPVMPVMVKEAPCQEEVIAGEDVDLYNFPAPVWHPWDGGPYIGSLGVVIARDPETGVRNAGIYREQLQGKNKMGIMARQHVGTILKKYMDRGMAMPIATAIGVEPSVLAASCFSLPYGQDELAAAGALQGEPVPLVKCKSIDLEVPAHAEIILEGEILPDPNQWEMEGPFGEYTGFYGGTKGKRPSIIVKTVTTRRDPICQGTREGGPPCESTTLRMPGKTASIWLRLEKAGIPGFKAVHVTDMGCANFIAVIALEKQYYLGNARQAIMSYWSLDHNHGGKWAIVVDDDIDIFDRAQVEWALATRVQPHRDIIITSDWQPGMPYDPSIHPDLQPYPSTRSSRIGIDATKDFKGFDFPPEIRSRPEDLSKVEKRWQEYGID